MFWFFGWFCNRERILLIRKFYQPSGAGNLQEVALYLHGFLSFVCFSMYPVDISLTFSESWWQKWKIYEWWLWQPCKICACVYVYPFFPRAIKIRTAWLGIGVFWKKPCSHSSQALTSHCYSFCPCHSKQFPEPQRDFRLLSLEFVLPKPIRVPVELIDQVLHSSCIRATSLLSWTSLSSTPHWCSFCLQSSSLLSLAFCPRISPTCGTLHSCCSAPLLKRRLLLTTSPSHSPSLYAQASLLCPQFWLSFS